MPASELDAAFQPDGRTSAVPEDGGGTDRPVAVILGASGAIGTALTCALAGADHRVLAVGRHRERLAQAGAASDRNIICLQADLRREPDRRALLMRAETLGRLDLVVMGAGIYARSHDPAVFSEQFDANVLAPYAILTGLLPGLIESRGQVVFLNSSQGLAASAGVGQYAATQHALRAVADSLRAEVNQSGVRVTSVFLGRTATDRQKDIFCLEGRSYVPERLIQPKDVADIVLAAARLARTAEVTDISVRPMLKT